ncbi:15334_t:CDS:2 [Gigaspora margarita]|uniref:15334_t:CDS:1 n=1 Tax=Gigaspora margarita TaxID=4874 RepID=A0ABN7UNG1_GIGMA|nr:15334_t:CDS:2 [Gigaspora margarita]
MSRRAFTSMFYYILFGILVLIYAQAQNYTQKSAETLANHITPTIFAKTC